MEAFVGEVLCGFSCVCRKMRFCEYLTPQKPECLSCSVSFLFELWSGRWLCIFPSTPRDPSHTQPAAVALDHGASPGEFPS